MRVRGDRNFLRWNKGWINVLAMARVRELFQDDRHGRAHPTEVECGWQVVTGQHGERLLQLSTYGSDDRQSEKKVSQTIQLDRVLATQLIEVMRETFRI